MSDNLEKITGYVEHIIYRNDDNGYTVFNLNNDDGDLTCVGTFLFISEGERYELMGEYKNHSMYGNQLVVSSHEVLEPDDVISIERYLGSGAIKGIGIALAGRIVRRFKGDTFRIIEEEPERLAEIKGISERKAREICNQVEEKKDMRKAMLYLQKYGISTTLAAKIYTHYGSSIYRVLEENPYQIAEKVPGVGFKTADEIAMKVGIHTDSDFRIRSGLFYTLQQCVNEGHVYLPQELLLRRASNLLGVSPVDMEKYVQDLAIEKRVVLKRMSEDVLRVYPSHYYYLELNTAKMLHDLNVESDVADVVVENRLAKIEKNAGLELDEKQRQAVVQAVRQGLLILTGGPGTGKTTTINAMIRFFESEGLDIYLAAPTGRAAKRMTEATGYEAQTIHRLLEVSGNPEEDGPSGFGRNMENPLEADVIIIDEMSMVDINLIHALLSAIVVGTRVILVGDVNQLPSVGPGSVLKDIIESKAFPTVMLTKIFRQAGESDIVVNAHHINQGEPVVLDNKSQDFFFMRRQDPNVIISLLIQMIQKNISNFVGAAPNDVQVLTPMRKGALGVEQLNIVLQEHLNPPDKKKKEREYGDRIFRVGDKVMQIKNNYQLEWEISTKFGLVVDKGLGVFNGDMGIVTDINAYEEYVEVTYEEQRKVRYTFKMLDELELAYVITIHKSQGSEYPAVLIPLLPGPRLLYNRNLIYTAITRAKKCVVLVGDEGTFQEMIQNTHEQKRYTSLAERIQEF